MEKMKNKTVFCNHCGNKIDGWKLIYRCTICGKSLCEFCSIYFSGVSVCRYDIRCKEKAGSLYS